MTEYYEIIGRAQQEPFKERLRESIMRVMLFGWIAVPCFCAIYIAISTMDIVNGLLALVVSGLLGFILFPYMAIAEGMLFAIVLCSVYTVLILFLIVSSVTKSRQTKREQNQILQLRLREKEFEAKYPRAPEIKREYLETRAERNKAKRIVKDALNSTSIKEINEDFLLGKISKEEHERLIDSYQVCKYRAEQEAFLDEVTEELCNRLKEELQGYITEFEQGE